MRRAALASVLCFALTGCGGIWSAGTGSGSSSSSEAAANVRAAIPATEAYFADNGTYAGISAEKLRATYDNSITDVRFTLANARTYCIESAAGTESYSKRGPGGDVLPGAC